MTLDESIARYPIQKKLGWVKEGKRYLMGNQLAGRYFGQHDAAPKLNVNSSGGRGYQITLHGVDSNDFSKMEMDPDTRTCSVFYHNSEHSSTFV